MERGGAERMTAAGWGDTGRLPRAGSIGDRMVCATRARIVVLRNRARDGRRRRSVSVRRIMMQTVARA